MEERKKKGNKMSKKTESILYDFIMKKRESEGGNACTKRKQHESLKGR